jgi:glycosyltransferase involved in cell wall biosynthesis
MTKISVIIPLLNEAENLELLHERLTAVLPPLDPDYEIVYVDDGSTDQSLTLLEEIYDKDKTHVRIIEFRRNFGKTAGLVAGFEQAEGDILITMDADLQDDPDEIPAMVAELDKGYDLVAAWRKERQDRSKKKFSSKLFNYLVTKSTGTTFNDLNCGFKVYRRSVIKSIRLYSDLHRFVPLLAVWKGFRVVEKPVTHHERHKGESKYGTGRAFRGFMDLIMVLFLMRYARNPLRLFGWTGIAIFMGGVLINLYLAFLWILRLMGTADISPIGTRPLFSVGILSMILGFQLISIGLLGEMVRYYLYDPGEEYSIRRVWQ